ncbi:MAG: hypothetical protein M1834_005074 [Cirrosporium novae-zelandiae]|nr:MAG: hypothetical protein M1834_005074 [Cirrosporium novae-zelandiae]
MKFKSGLYMYLPPEIILHVLDFLRADRENSDYQVDIYSCCLVSRDWYNASVEHLYPEPWVAGHRFEKFAKTITDSRKSDFAKLVKCLDLSMLVHESNASKTARLIGRLKDNLEIFVAPRFSFGTASLPALSKCSRLWDLDLSEYRPKSSANYKAIFEHTKNLQSLTHLQLPPFQFLETFDFPLPPKLQELTISLPEIWCSFDQQKYSIPTSLSKVTLRKCSGNVVKTFLKHVSVFNRLTRLAIIYATDDGWAAPLSYILTSAPDLRFLRIDPSYIQYFLPPYDDLVHPLEVLQLEKDTSMPPMFGPYDILNAARQKSLGNLRLIKLRKSLRQAWARNFSDNLEVPDQPVEHPLVQNILDSLDRLLINNARARAQDSEVEDLDNLNLNAGVRIIP